MKIGTMVKVEPSEKHGMQFLRGLTGKVTQVSNKEGKPHRVTIDLPKLGRLNLLAEDVVEING